MQKIQNIAVASNSSDVFKLKQLEKRGGKNFKVFATTLEASKTLEKTRLPFAELDIPANQKTIKALQVQAKLLIDRFINDPQIIKTFCVDEVNILEFLTNRFHIFLLRMVLGFLNVQQIKKARGNVNLILFNKNIINDYDSPFNPDFNSLAFYIWSQYHKEINLRIVTDDNLKKNNIVFETVIKKTNAILNFLHYTKDKYSKEPIQIALVLPASHATELIKLFKNLEEKNINYLVLVHNLGIKERVELVRNGVKFIDRESLNEKTIIREAWNISLRIRKHWEKEKGELTILKPDNEKNRFLEKALNYRIKTFLKSEITQLLTDYLIAKKTIQNYKPNIVVTTTDPDPKVLPFIKTAQKKNVKTITIQHGTYALAAGVNFQSDKMLAWGSYYKNWFKQNLNKKGYQIYITGSPFFDNMKLTPFKKKFIKSVKKYSILFLLSDIVTISVEKALEKISEKLTTFGIDNIYVRSHPWQKIAGINFNGKLNLGNKIMANDKNLDYYLDKSQIVVTTNTTAGFNSLVKGKPLIYWHLKGAEYLPFEKAGVPVATNASQVINSVKEIKDGKYHFSSNKRRKLIKEVFYKLDGRSSERVANLLEN